jgi:hypothetical protein
VYGRLNKKFGEKKFGKRHFPSPENLPAPYILFKKGSDRNFGLANFIQSTIYGPALVPGFHIAGVVNAYLLTS